MLVNNLRLGTIRKQERKAKSSNHNGKSNKFNISDSTASAETNSSSHTGGVSSVNPFLAIQEFDVVLENHERLQQHGKSLLKKLRNIRLALLNQEAYIDEIIAVKDYLANANLEFEFPQYQQLINEIITRAEVEIAKHEMFEKENGGR